MKKNRQHSARRQQIAAEAARYIAQQGGGNLQLAREKAARRFGIRDRRSKDLPDLSEIEQQLTTYQLLYQSDSHPQQVQHQRELAIKAMQLFKTLNPRLTGPVLTGTAGENTPITIYTDTEYPEAIAHILLDRSIPYTLGEYRVHYGRQAELVPCYRFEAGNQRIEVVALPWSQRHNRTNDPATEVAESQATLKELISLAEASETITQQIS